MKGDEFLLTVKGLNCNHGIPYAEIARALDITYQWLYRLLNHQDRVGITILRRADIAFPELMKKFPRIENFRKYTKYGINLEVRKDEVGKKEKERRDRILGITEGREDPKVRVPFALDVIKSSKT